MTIASESSTRTNITDKKIKRITIIALETVFKRGEIYGCATTIAINVDGIIPTPQGFIMSGSVIQALFSSVLS